MAHLTIMPRMRDNPVKKTLAGGGRALGSMVFEFFTPGMPRILANAGAEFALYDFIARALDCGALGVMVPLVDTAEQAQFIVSCTRYPPEGRRGAAFGFAHDDFEGGDVVEKMRMIHARTLAIAMIETAKGLDNVEAIAAVPGVDVLWLGHFDLTNFLGIPAQFTHPLYLQAIQKITTAAARHGKAAGYMAADAALGREYLGHGFRMIATGTDQGMLQAAIAANIGAWRSK